VLSHERLQEQLLEDRRRELAALERRPAPPRHDPPYLLLSVRAIWPLLTHRIFGIPAPAKPASGC
jgi:hypothetical protein